MDFRVIGASAWFWLPEIAIGIPLGWGALPRLVRLLGPARAKRFIILCDRFKGREAVDFGLAEYLVADGQAYADQIRELVEGTQTSNGADHNDDVADSFAALNAFPQAGSLHIQREEHAS